MTYFFLHLLWEFWQYVILRLNPINQLPRCPLLKNQKILPPTEYIGFHNKMALYVIEIVEEQSHLYHHKKMKFLVVERVNGIDHFACTAWDPRSSDIEFILHARHLSNLFPSTATLSIPPIQASRNFGFWSVFSVRWMPSLRCCRTLAVTDSHHDSMWLFDCYEQAQARLLRHQRLA